MNRHRALASCVLSLLVVGSAVLTTGCSPGWSYQGTPPATPDLEMSLHGRIHSGSLHVELQLHNVGERPLTLDAVDLVAQDANDDELKLTDLRVEYHGAVQTGAVDVAKNESCLVTATYHVASVASTGFLSMKPNPLLRKVTLYLSGVKRDGQELPITGDMDWDVK